MEHIPRIKESLLGFLKESKPKTLVSILKLCSDTYYNSNANLITDEEYDRIREHLEDIDPKNKYLLEVGAPINDEKIDLPYWMGSMNKKKKQEASHAWAEIYFTDLGWKAYDVSNGSNPDENYVSLAKGFDYTDVAPVKGVKIGTSLELMTTEIIVQ